METVRIVDNYEIKASSNNGTVRIIVTDKETDSIYECNTHVASMVHIRTASIFFSKQGSDRFIIIGGHRVYLQDITHIFTREFPKIPKYFLMSKEEQLLARSAFRTKFRILQDAWKDYNIPDITDNMSLEEIHECYEITIRNIRVNEISGTAEKVSKPKVIKTITQCVEEHELRIKSHKSLMDGLKSCQNAQRSLSDAFWIQYFDDHGLTLNLPSTASYDDVFYVQSILKSISDMPDETIQKCCKDCSKIQSPTDICWHNIQGFLRISNEPVASTAMISKSFS